MKSPIKSRNLYRNLREGILNRHYRPGELLPAEEELAVSLGVSRGTLRRALDSLEQESLVKRVRGHGTYVSEAVRRNKITFLLPCAGEFGVAQHFVTEVLGGVIEAALELNCEVETPAISPTNHSEDIDLSKLFNIHSSGRVVMMGFWFAKVFPFLVNSGCRVGFIHDGTYQAKQHTQTLSRWVVGEKDQETVAFRMMKELIRRGSRHPAASAKILLEEDSPMLRGFARAFAEAGLPLANLTMLPEGEEIVSRDGFCGLQKKHRFDGLLTMDAFLYESACEAGWERPAGLFDLLQRNCRPSGENVFYSEFPLRKMGKEIARLVNLPSYAPGSLKFMPEIYNHRGEPIR